MHFIVDITSAGLFNLHLTNEYAICDLNMQLNGKKLICRIKVSDCKSHQADEIIPEIQFLS